MILLDKGPRRAAAESGGTRMLCVGVWCAGCRQHLIEMAAVTGKKIAM